MTTARRCTVRYETLARTLLHANLVAAIFAAYPGLQPTALAATTPTPPVKEKHAAPPAKPAAAPIDFPTIVQRYGPAVVNITAAGPDQRASAPPFETLDSDDPISAFFRHGAAPSSEPAANAPRAISGAGSGFIISADGLILTSAHVVDQAEEVTVRLADKRELKGKVVAVDNQSDIAVVQIEATKLPTVKLGDSSHVRAGEQVLTIGSPDGVDNTVTAGLVSATTRLLPDGSSFPFFQTDVAVNPDNSGGPLFNHAGEVVGIDVEIYSDGDRSPILTFAIPINLAAKVRSQALTQHGTSPGALGVEVQDVGAGLAVAFGLPRPAGALVNSVQPGSSAAASGIKPGDVIVQIGDKPIDRSAELAEDAAALQPGAKTALKLIRNRKPMTLTVTLGAAKAADGAAQTDGGPDDRLGLAMHPLTDDERRTSGVAAGLVVDEVHEPASTAGIQPGDIVLSLNGTPVASQEQVVALEAKAGEAIAVLIQRNNARSYVSVELR